MVLARKDAEAQRFEGWGVATSSHQLSLRDTIDGWCCDPGLERPGYHQVPLRGKAQMLLLAERGPMVVGGFNPRKRCNRHGVAERRMNDFLVECRRASINW